VFENGCFVRRFTCGTLRNLRPCTSRSPMPPDEDCPPRADPRPQTSRACGEHAGRNTPGTSPSGRTNARAARSPLRTAHSDIRRWAPDHLVAQGPCRPAAYMPIIASSKNAPSGHRIAHSFKKLILRIISQNHPPAQSLSSDFRRNAERTPHRP